MIISVQLFAICERNLLETVLEGVANPSLNETEMKPPSSRIWQPFIFLLWNDWNIQNQFRANPFLFNRGSLSEQSIISINFEK